MIDERFMKNTLNRTINSISLRRGQAALESRTRNYFSDVRIYEELLGEIKQGLELIQEIADPTDRAKLQLQANKLHRLRSDITYNILKCIDGENREFVLGGALHNLNDADKIARINLGLNYVQKYSAQNPNSSKLSCVDEIAEALEISRANYDAPMDEDYDSDSQPGMIDDESDEELAAEGAAQQPRLVIRISRALYERHTMFPLSAGAQPSSVAMRASGPLFGLNSSTDQMAAAAEVLNGFGR